MPKKNKIQTGDVVYIRKNEEQPDTLPSVSDPAPPPEVAPPVAPESVPSIAPTTLQKTRAKKPLTEGRKEHLTKLAELNRKRREEAKKPPTVEIPEPPGDAVRMTVRPKRTYKKKDKDFWEHITTAEEKRKGLEDLKSSNEVVYPVVELEKPKAKAKAKPQPKTVRILKAPPKPRKSREEAMPRSLPLRRQSGHYGRKDALSEIEDDDEEDSEESEESESDEEEVERVVRKTHKRLSTLEKIDKRLKDLQNPYAVRGLSVF